MKRVALFSLAAVLMIGSLSGCDGVPDAGGAEVSTASHTVASDVASAEKSTSAYSSPSSTVTTTAAPPVTTATEAIITSTAAQHSLSPEEEQQYKDEIERLLDKFLNVD